MIDALRQLDREDVYSGLGRDDRALSDYNEATKIEREKAKSYYRKGWDQTAPPELNGVLKR